MNKNDYFIEREKKRMDKALEDDKVIAVKLDEIYKKNFKEIENQIDIFIGRYAFRENISMLEARKLVNNLDLKEYATKAKEYVKNKDLSDKANREMSIYNLKLKVTRLEMLKKNIALELARLGTIEEDELQKHLEDIAQNQVDHNANIFNMNDKTQKDILESSKVIINASYKDATFSDRIWANQRGLKADLDKLIDRTILRGESPQKWAKELKRNLQDVRKNARFNAERLAITESHRVLNDINLISIKEAGYNCVKIISEPGACHLCKPHDGKIVNLDDERSIRGDKLPTWHPYCRCSFAAYDDVVDEKVEKRENREYNIDERKLTEYALNPEKQPDKARAFKEALGYDLSNYDELIQNVHSNLKTNEFNPKGRNDYGELFEQVLNLLGPNGKRANVITGWIKKENAIHLTSIYVTKKKRGNL
ncbi:minor capsid protein [Helcococcus bovis]|uniref:minor capsid protein n=1 Tax=Helcococcus bovis TaxID=3153252 RepID=UPI0038BBD75C